LLVLIVSLTILVRHSEVSAKSTRMGEQLAGNSKPGLAVAPEAKDTPAADANTNETIQAQSKTSTKSKNKAKAERKIAKATPEAKLLKSDNQAKIIDNNGTEHNSTITTSSGGTKSYISVTCVEGTDVFVDGIRKGRIGSKPLTIAVPQGKHTVIVSHTSRGIFTQGVELKSGKTVHIKPSLCN
jgi:hypothetical protein